MECTGASDLCGSSLASDKLRSLGEVVSTFDSTKRRLVSSIGFGGLLLMPPLKQLNKRFSFWLMNKVDASRCAIVLDNGTSIPFTNQDVGYVFGIPCTGKKVSGKKFPRMDVRDRILRGVLRLDSKQQGSLTAAQNVLDRAYGDEMTKDEEECFKIAFVVFVMSSLLAPGPRTDYATGDYWNALADPSEIGNYDWGSFVIERLLNGVAKVKADNAAKSRVTKLSGCPLFLQVLYLDSVDLGPCNLNHRDLPRIQYFSEDRITSMIAADTVINPDCRSNKGFGCSKLRSPSDICYSWSNLDPGVRSGASVDGCEAKLRVVQWAWSMVSDFINRLCSGDLEMSSNVLESIPDVDLSQIFCDLLRKGSSTRKRRRSGVVRPCSHCGGEAEVDVLTPCSPWDLFVEAEGSDICEDGEHAVQCSEAKAMSRRNLLKRQSKVYEFIDPNIESSGSALVDSSIVTPAVQSTCVVKSPWELGATMDLVPAELVVTIEVLNSLHRTMPGDIPCFVHYVPKYVEVSSSSATAQFLGLGEFDTDLMAVLIRRFKQADDVLNREYPRVRWRHFVETDFMDIVLAGLQCRFESNIRAQFVGSHLGYDVRRCQMFFFPAITKGRWVCYAWSISKNVIVIFDPCRAHLPSDQVCRLHRTFLSLLKSAMHVVSSKYFLGWQYDWRAADAEVFSVPGQHVTSLARLSGLMVAYFCRNFDGSCLSPSFPADKFDYAAAILWRDAVQLSGNYGTIPPAAL